MSKPTFEEAQDPVNHPKHYTSHPSGIECIRITEHMNFCLGNAVKYIWRADEKGNDLEDLQKAAWYIAREIERRAKLLQATAAPDSQEKIWYIRCPDTGRFWQSVHKTWVCEEKEAVGFRNLSDAKLVGERDKLRRYTIEFSQ